MSMHNLLGEICSLSSAVLWAIAVILFKKSGERIHPVALNLFKTVMAFGLYIPTMLALGEKIFLPVPGKEYALFIASGMIGIGLADVLFFLSLNKLGAGLNAVIGCLYSPTIIALSVIFLGEKMAPVQYVGVALVVGAVLFVSTPKSRPAISPADFWTGTLFGILSMIFMGIGIVMIKPKLDSTPVLWAIETRLCGAILSMLFVLYIFPDRRKIIKSLLEGTRDIYTIAGSFVGNYLALVVWIAGMKYTLASISAALNQTSNLFVFVFAAIFLKEKITAGRAGSIILGIIGALLVILGTG